MARLDGPRRRRFRSPPPGAILGIVALSFGTLAPGAEAAFLGSSPNEHNRFATATASFEAEATLTFEVFEDGSTTGEPAPGPGDTATYSFTFSYPQEVHLDGVATAELQVERDAPGNSPGEVGVELFADDAPIAAGGSGDIRGDGRQTVSFPLDDLGRVSQTFPAETLFRVDVELWRVRMELGGASRILLPLAE